MYEHLGVVMTITVQTMKIQHALKGINESPQTGMGKQGGHVEARTTQLPQRMNVLR